MTEILWAASFLSVRQRWMLTALKATRPLNRSPLALIDLLNSRSQILLQQEDSPQDKRQKVYLQVQLQQAGDAQLPLH